MEKQIRAACSSPLDVEFLCLHQFMVQANRKLPNIHGLIIEV